MCSKIAFYNSKIYPRTMRAASSSKLLFFIGTYQNDSSIMYVICIVRCRSIYYFRIATCEYIINIYIYKLYVIS